VTIAILLRLNACAFIGCNVHYAMLDGIWQ
jgi:hypothetical protein